MKKFLVYLWQSKLNLEREFYVGMTSRSLHNRLENALSSKKGNLYRHEVDLLEFKEYLNYEKALSCEAGAIHFLKKMEDFDIITCLNTNKNIYNNIVDPPKEFHEGSKLCNQVLGRFVELKAKIKSLTKEKRKILEREAFS